MGRLWNDIKGSVKDQGSGKVLTMDQVKEIQQVLLMMLQDIDRICRDNGLRYVLIGGSAIGSIRHRGFIPWDDDADIAMPRADYEKFAKIVNLEWGKKYTLTDAIRKNNYGKVIPKLRLNGTVYKTVLDIDPADIQMKTDIFIIENVSDNLFFHGMHGFLCTCMGFLLSCRRLAEKREYFAQFYKGKDFKFKVVTGTLLRFASLVQWAYWTEKCYSMCKNDHSRLVTLPSDGLHFFKGTIRRAVICETVEKEFEGQKLFLPREYDFYLRRIYGDYMQIPPEEKRMLSIYSEIDYGKYNSYGNARPRAGS